MIEVKAPNAYTVDRPVIFLGGAIEQGKAENWQERVVNALTELNVIFLNPRRDDWDSSWVQSIEDHRFRQQVEWELAGQDLANLCIYVFGSDEEQAKLTKAPVTLLELGLQAKTQQVLVCCPKGYYRKGNIDIVCKKYNVPLYENLNDLIGAIRTKFSTRRY
jgi:hypothetical protein